MRSFALVILLFFTSVVPTFAHLAGQPPFFTVNKEYTALYPVSIISTQQMILPQDIAIKTYLVGDPLAFAIEANKLPIPLDTIAKTRFSWDFGDGTTGEGLEQDHVYTKPGSYILAIYADFSALNETFEPQLIQSALIHILSDKEYQLPTVKIRANDIIIKDPIVDTVEIQKGQVRLAAEVKKGTAQIKSITWDIGDGTIATKSAITHTYPTNRQYYFPFVRVTDTNGFIVDTYVELENVDPALQKKSDPPKKPLILLLGVVVLGISLFFFWYTQLKKTKT